MKYFPVIPISLGLALATIYSCDKNCACDNCNTPQTKTLTLQPGTDDGKDAVISDRSTTTNWGSHKEFTALSWTCSGVPCLLRSLIEFDLTPISKGATGTHAT